MHALHPRAPVTVVALVGAAMALVLTLALRDAETASGPSGPRLLMPLYAFEALDRTPVPAPADTSAPAAPALPSGGMTCLVAAKPCDRQPCIRFVAGPSCDPLARPKAHFHRIAAQSP